MEDGITKYCQQFFEIGEAGLYKVNNYLKILRSVDKEKNSSVGFKETRIEKFIPHRCITRLILAISKK